MGGEVRSSFGLDQITPLQFGTLFAKTDPDHQASLRLLPDGRITIINNGDAKLVSLGVPAPARLLVTGAAPNRLLSIAVDASEIKLKLPGNPTAPYFTLTALETSPDSAGHTDRSGQLEIAVGGTLSTQKTQKQVYPAGAYEATYSLTVSY
nr:DUF4402 domain-containing protein [Marinobacter sp. S6332]